MRPPAALKLDSSNLAEEWKFWLQKFELYLQASGASEKSEATQLAIFLHCLGDDALRVYNSFQFNTESQRESLNVVREKFKEYCTPRKNVVFERHQFFKIAQTEGEMIDSFITKLRLQAKSCDFGMQEESLIRDRIVLGCQDASVQERLLREPDLTLQKAMDMCRSSEATKERLKQIQPASAAVAAFRKRPTQGKQTEQQSCRNCGKNHQRGQCPAYGKTCTYCGKLNHFSKYCFSNHPENGQENRKSKNWSHSQSPQSMTTRNSQTRSNNRRVHHVQDLDNESDY